MAENIFNDSPASCCQDHLLKALNSNDVIANQAANPTFEPTAIKFTKQHTSQLENWKIDNSTSFNSLNESLNLLPISICYIIFGVIIVIFIERRKAIKKGLIISEASDICPCKDCRFFGNDSRLYCAVHPSDAMTERAINCPDYCPNNLLTKRRTQVSSNYRNIRNIALDKLQNLYNRISR
jgi:hypothetical protein